MDTPIAQIATQTNQNDAPQLPHNIEAEQGLLGALLINNDAVEQLSDFLLARHFFDPVHARSIIDKKRNEQPQHSRNLFGQ